MRGKIYFIFPMLVICFGLKAAASTLIFNNLSYKNPISGFAYDGYSDQSLAIYFLPKGLRHDGLDSDSYWTYLFPRARQAEWTSRYASIVSSDGGCRTVDGINEKGFSAHLLERAPSVVDVGHDGHALLSTFISVQYLLDQADSVADALELLQRVSIVGHAPPTLNFVEELPASIAFEDASGDSAVVEFSGRSWIVFRGHEFRVFTTGLPYADQTRMVERFKHENSGKESSIPGGFNSSDRAVRASYLLAKIPQQTGDQYAISSMMTILRNISVPFAVSTASDSAMRTQYRMVSDMAKLEYLVESAGELNIFRVNIGEAEALKSSSPLVFFPSLAARGARSGDKSGAIANRFRVFKFCGSLH